jgi:hypothetical protein
MMDRNQWQFFSGLNSSGSPTWSSNISDRQPVFTDAVNGTGWGVSVIYHPILHRYLLTTRPVGDFTNSSWGLFDAPEPWGPWTTVTYLDSFRDSTWKFTYEFNQKWMSANDLALWMVFSGVEVYDSFNVIKATLALKTDREALHIDSPTAGTVLTPGQTVTATGTGTNLSWDVDRIHDGLASFATGSESSITFMIPADSTSDQVIVIRLSGDGGSDEQTYAISGVPPGTVHAINAGGGTAGLFGADTGYSGGYTYATSAWIDTSIFAWAVRGTVKLMF